MVDGEGVKQGTLSKGHPAIAAAPVGDTVRVLIIIETVIVQTSGAVIDVVIEGFDLADGEVEIAGVAGGLAHTREERDAHIEIVGPEGHGAGPVTGERTVGEFDLYVPDIVRYFFQVVHVGRLFIEGI